MKDDNALPDKLAAELKALRGRCADYEQRLQEQQEAVVELSLRRNEEFIVLYSLLEFSKTISASSDRVALVESALRLLRDTFGLGALAIFELRREQQDFVLVGSSIPAADASGLVLLPTNDPLVQPVLQSAQVCHLDQLAASGSCFCPSFVPDCDAAIGAPMLLYGELRGAIIAFAPRGTDFDERHFQIMSAIAAHLAIGIESADLRSRMQQQAFTDELTGLVNRRALNDRLIEEVARAQRHREPLCLLMIDLDHFKELNDSYGHATGDVVLKQFGRLLRETVRCGDTCARYGGEEFAVILPQTDIELAYIVASRIRQAMEDLGTPGLGCDQKSSQRHITVSIGVASATTDEVSAQSLIDRADLALYQAKTQGRNRVSVF